MTLSPREIADAAREASQRTGISSRQFEKDYYVTCILREVFAAAPDEVVFKGGTSLSKAYGLIDRFSEDIDLLIVPRDGSGKRVDEVLDEIDRAATLAVPGAELKRQGGSPGQWRTTAVTPRFETQKDGVSGKVVVESGRRGGPRPTERRTIRPWLAEVIDELSNEPDFHAFQVTVLHPGRTLVEKLFAVTEMGRTLVQNPDATVRSRQARHFYDIHRLLTRSDDVLDWLSRKEDFTAVVRDCESVSRTWFEVEAPPLTGSFADAEVFVQEALTDRLAGALAEACADLCHPGSEVPTWEDVIATVKRYRGLLTVA